jgi:hypothetical protein
VVLFQVSMIFTHYRGDTPGEAIPAHFILELAIAEAIGAVLFLLPWTLRVGGWILIGVFLVAALAHVVHGQFGGVGTLAYAAAVLAVMYNRRDAGD